MQPRPTARPLRLGESVGKAALKTPLVYSSRVATVGGLRKVIVRGLFGSRDHEIGIDPERPTVLTGANGSGKSTLLRLVNAASTGDVRTLASAPLEAFELHFESQDPFVLRRSSTELADLSWGEYSSSVAALPHLADLPDWASQGIEDSQGSEEDIEDVLAEAAQVAGAPFNEFAEVRQLVGEGDRHSLSPASPGWMREFTAAFPVLFITDQRLVVESPAKPRRQSPRRKRRPRLAVEAASAELRRQMERVDSAYARVSQEQDRRFPRDVIAAMSQPAAVPLPDLEELLKTVDQRRESLRAVGLLDSDTGYEPYLAADSLQQERVRPVIATFLRSTLEKLEVLEDLSARLQLFQSFLNERFAGKSMRLNRRDGVRFALDGESLIRPRDLSSGEQQMMVLAYEILFRAGEGTLVILDEPEISLHVLWQDTLIENLAGMGRASRLQFLLATHSPVLLASHPELERSLDRDVDRDQLSPT